MNRRQRRIHALVWPLIAIVLAATIAIAMIEQQRVAAAFAPPAAAGGR